MTVTFTCADAVSGVASCPAPVTLSSDGANQSVSRTATDRAGNSSAVSISGINIDRTAPTETATVLGTPTNGWYRGPATVRFTCHDGLS